MGRPDPSGRCTGGPGHLHGGETGELAAPILSGYRRQRVAEHKPFSPPSMMPDFGGASPWQVACSRRPPDRARHSESGIVSGRRGLASTLVCFAMSAGAALKLSPFSTLTRVSQGKIIGEAPETLAWAAGSWRDVAATRAALSGRGGGVLRAIARFRERLELRLNPTLAEFARTVSVPPSGALDSRRPRSKAPQQAASRREWITADLTESVFGELSGIPRIYGELAVALAVNLEAPKPRRWRWTR